MSNDCTSYFLFHSSVPRPRACRQTSSASQVERRDSLWYLAFVERDQQAGTGSGCSGPDRQAPERAAASQTAVKCSQPPPAPPAPPPQLPTPAAPSHPHAL